MCCSCIPRTPLLFFGNHCIRSTASTASKKLSKIVLVFHHFLGQPLLMRCHGCSQPARLQDSKILRRHVKTAAITMHLKITRGFTQTREFHVKKGTSQCILYTSKSHCIFYKFQSLSTALVSLASFQKKNGGNNDHPISLSHRIIPFRPPWHLHTAGATPRTASSRLHRARSPWSPEVR